MQRPEEIRIVCLGGGTGLSTLLSGLKYVSIHSPFQVRNHALVLKNLTGIVTVSDDGGSSGRIRDQYETPAPGDIRDCLVALASDESLMTRLFRYRFRTQGELNDHSLGNLLLTALTDITGDFVQAVKLVSEVLAVEGQILPSTNTNVRLRAVLCDGTEVRGESKISQARSRVQRIFLDPESCPPLPEAVEAIQAADLITAGPGSLCTSIIPNLLVEEIFQAMERADAVKIYISNLMTERGETDHFTAADHVEAICRHLGRENPFRHILLNSQSVSPEMIEQYQKEEAEPVLADVERLRAMGLVVHQYPLLREEGVVRHHPVRLAEAILDIFEREKEHERKSD